MEENSHYKIEIAMVMLISSSICMTSIEVRGVQLEGVGWGFGVC
jgi:hypothetical protein